jgi:hypothetical protein
LLPLGTRHLGPPRGFPELVSNPDSFRLKD